MVFRKITPGSAEYLAECELRETVLRRPLGLRLTSEDLAAERIHLHFGLFDAQGRLVATVIAVPLGDGNAKVRQMAVSPKFVGRGFGSRILRELEDRLRKEGVHHVRLHARTSAAGFYRKAGYVEAGPEFEEVGIPHVRMEKSLPSAD